MLKYRFFSSKLKQGKGFTLLELIVIFVVIAILAALAIPSFTQVQNDAHQASVNTTAAAVLRDATSLAAYKELPASSYDPNNSLDTFMYEAFLELPHSSQWSLVPYLGPNYPTDSLGNPLEFTIYPNQYVHNGTPQFAACIVSSPTSNSGGYIYTGVCTGAAYSQSPQAVNPVSFSLNPVPAAPTNFTAPETSYQAGGGIITLSWADPYPSSGGQPFAYEIYKNGSLIATVMYGTTTYKEAFQPYGTYLYTIVATNQSGTSPSTSADGVVIAPPSTPTDVQAAPSYYTVNVTWGTPSTGGAVANYLVYRDGALIATVPAGTNSYADNNVSAGTHTYGVAAENAAGTSSTATASASVIVTPPSQLTITQTQNNATTNNLALSWVAPPGPTPASYLIYEGNSLIGTVVGTTTAYTVDAVASGTYQFGVAAANAAGAMSTQATDSVSVAIGPTSPTSLAVTWLANYVYMYWQPPATGSQTPTSYLVYQGSSLIATLPASQTTFVTDPNPGTYTYSVVAADTSGESAPAAESVTLLPPPSNIVESGSTTATATVSWQSTEPLVNVSTSTGQTIQEVDPNTFYETMTAFVSGQPTPTPLTNAQMLAITPGPTPPNNNSLYAMFSSQTGYVPLSDYYVMDYQSSTTALQFTFTDSPSYPENYGMVASANAQGSTTFVYEGIATQNSSAPNPQLVNLTNATCSANQTFYYTGNIQDFTVPNDCISGAKLTVTLAGAQGGNSVNGYQGGLGSTLTATMIANDGTTFQIGVGNQSPLNQNSDSWPDGGYRGNTAGGPGGGSSLFVGPPSSTDTTPRTLMQAGAGGGAGTSGNGGVGGYLAGSNGFGPQAGYGATTTSGAGGAAGGPYAAAGACNVAIGLPDLIPGHGFSPAPTYAQSGGGGGGGACGGGGGDTYGGGGGGDGMVYSPAVTYVSSVNGNQSGNGYVTVTATQAPLS